MNKRIRKKKYKQSLVKCTKCECYTEYYREEDEGGLCPNCFAEYVGLSTEEVYRVKMELEHMLSFADLTLLGSFKNGSEGENNFYEFMRLVRTLKEESDEQETYIKLLQQEVIEMRDSTDYDRGRD